MIANLPDDSAYARSVGMGWTTTDYILARISDRLDVANWQRRQGKAADYPKPMWRPGTEQPERKPNKVMSIEEARAKFRRKG